MWGLPESSGYPHYLNIQIIRECMEDNRWKAGYFGTFGFLGLLAIPTKNHGLLRFFGFFGFFAYCSLREK
jgi:hypothetical protein